MGGDRGGLRSIVVPVGRGLVRGGGRVSEGRQSLRLHGARVVRQLLRLHGARVVRQLSRVHTEAVVRLAGGGRDRGVV